MTALVLDASISLSWCFEEEADPYADSVLLAFLLELPLELEQFSRQETFGQVVELASAYGLTT